MEKTTDRELMHIISEIEADPENAVYTQRGIPPVFQIHRDARLLIIGQAPGRKVEQSRIPFHDQSGKKLIQWLGIDEATFYSRAVSILPIDFYYPGKGRSGDLPPRRSMAGKYHPRLLALMPDIRLTVLVGAYSCHFYLGKQMERNLTETVRHYARYMPDYFPIVHPSPLNTRWLKQHPWFEETVVPALRQSVQDALMDRQA